MDDMDQYFDFSQGDFQPSPIETRSPVAKLEQPMPSNAIDPQALFRLQQHLPESARQYNGPSHEYDRFKQQTGFPSGAIANVAALNEMNTNSYISPFAMGGPSGYSSGIDFTNELTAADGSSSSSSQLFGADAFDDFIDPNSIDTQPAPAPARLFPGMHSQQAQQQKQQKQAAAASASHLPQSQQMLPILPGQSERRTSDADDNSLSPGPSDAKGSKFIDEDMDEDERLLASEEGKKLSSKERRQLRNKVSARAFRSRRKEYISQLEGEVAAKVQESSDLKTRVRQLEEQNNQLTQLTRMLLSHPAFNQVMNEMSNDPNILAPIKQQQQKLQQQSQQQQQQPPQTQQIPQGNNNTFVGMSMIPETNLNLSGLNLGHSNNTANNSTSDSQWSNDQSFGGAFQQEQQVFAVTHLPEATFLSSEKSIIPQLPSLSEKSQPTLPSTLEASKPQAPAVSVELDPSHPAYELYSDAKPVTTPIPEPSIAAEDAVRMLNMSLNGKTPVHFELITVESHDESVLAASLDKLFAPAEAIFERLQLSSSHLPGR